MKKVTMAELQPLDTIIKDKREYVVSSVSRSSRKNLVRIETTNDINRTEYFIGEPDCTINIKEALWYPKLVI